MDHRSYKVVSEDQVPEILRSSKETTLKVLLESGTFQDSTSNVFNLLPSAARNLVVFSDCKTKVRKYLVNRANARLIS